MGKRNTYMNGPAAPSYPKPPRVEAAEHLALMARRYANDRACQREVEEAITLWREALAPAPGTPGEEGT